ncbi:MAG: tRNA lysidine(34) synthetase TilS [Clostridia bacterium]|nr:tRNA lysidine(34) synthetase TilS [Clostridia bacterium]
MPKEHDLRLPYRLPHALAGKVPGEGVLLALSGGVDSMCLLHLLAEDAKRYQFPLILAHVNHGIRGEEALRDRAFCARVAAEYRLPIHILDADVPSLAKRHKTTLEEEARNVRYAYFADLMKAEGIPILVTAHHADDQLETVLFRLSRGCGPAGLGGIAPVRDFGTGVLVRPLLEVTRGELLHYADLHGIPSVEDSTNADRSCARNRIRHDVTPVLCELFPNLQQRTTALSASLREDEALLRSMARDFLQRRDTREFLLTKELLSLHPAIAKRVIALWVEERLQLSVSSLQMLTVWNLLTAEERRAEVTLTGGASLRIEQGHVYALRRELREAISYSIPVSVGEWQVPQSDIRVLVTKCDKNAKIYNLSTENAINLCIPSAMMKNVFWRSRKAGDMILLGGMHRKLRKLYSAKKIPLSLRERMPLLCDGDGILWAPMIGVRDGAAVTGEELLELRILPDKSESN